MAASGWRSSCANRGARSAAARHTIRMPQLHARLAHLLLGAACVGGRSLLRVPQRLFCVHPQQRIRERLTDQPQACDELQQASPQVGHGAVTQSA